ncbi:MAG TPA: choice-of-anchor B family protein [Vicinamibacteria bacterium]|nr:choice-of-anchor B family protein [Vicinamibacteria bacterium]
MWTRTVLSICVLKGTAALAQQSPAPIFDVTCDGGFAAGFPCERVDLLAHLPLQSLGGGDFHGNDLWGFTAQESGREFVLFGRENGTAFVEITNPTAPVFLGLLPSASAPSPWRDIKVYARHAYIVSEAPNHGMQVFDLGILLDIATPPVELTAAAVYRGEGLGNAHNIAINESTGFGYVLGSSTCNSGLHVVDLRAPKDPVFAGCYGDDFYTHDAQCVTYQGPDRDYRGREVCFAYNEDTLTIVDVTDKSRPRMVSKQSYPGAGYTHQGWITEDQLFLLLGDELDEVYYGHATRTRVWEIADLDRPVLVGAYEAATPSIDHNLYVRQGFAYQANYRAGLRILALDRIANGTLRQFAYFDIYPEDDSPEFSGAWSVYPFFPSGVVAVSGIEQGLFLLSPQLP